MRKVLNLMVESEWADHTKAQQQKEYLNLAKSVAMGFLLCWLLIFVLRAVN